MQKEQEINNILESFKKFTDTRIVTEIMDTGNLYLLITENPNDENNFDPIYLCNKKDKNIVHSSIVPTVKLIKMIKDAKQNVIWKK